MLVDGPSGNRAILSGGNVGSGPAFSGAGRDVELAGANNIAVADHVNRILRVNTTTGARTVLSGPGVGSGPLGSDLNNGSLDYLTADHNGFLIATDVGLPRILRVDPLNGNRTVITGNGIGTGTDMQSPREAVEYFVYTLVPEPSSVVLGALCSAALLLVAIRKKFLRAS
jgi:hypothetical protein